MIAAENLVLGGISLYSVMRFNKLFISTVININTFYFVSLKGGQKSKHFVMKSDFSRCLRELLPSLSLDNFEGDKLLWLKQ